MGMKMAKKKIEQCRSWRDFHQYARNHAGHWEEAGRHTKYYGPHGQTVLSRWSGDPYSVLRSYIIKQFKLVGIAVILILTSVYLLQFIP
jgi:hypothetical protein